MPPPTWEDQLGTPSRVIAERLQHTDLALGLLLQLVEMLGDEILDRVRWLELQRQYAFGGEDSQEHLHAMLELLDARETLADTALDPAIRRFAPLLHLIKASNIARLNSTSLPASYPKPASRA
jgi:hypothetical protein